MVRTALTMLVHLLTAPIVSETVEVERRGPVELTRFECRDINRSSIVQRVCYDRQQRHLLVATKGRYNQYCNVPADLFEALMAAPSMGQFFNRSIRGDDSGRLACRTHDPL
ncbi:MAG: KTSC domain-containing protein [Bradyrhizobium sp.]|uniref:KTSC domain-containing protein n=1 Tax=Bradyrhizobium sp. TaxID=376 RepID=UPI0025C0BBB2|nr:KTSC domain-containing protein [Bradyrhizobium sp.]MBI5262034.1 KTSC domain-containing protein [Bradyrhizobium sp.]